MRWRDYVFAVDEQVWPLFDAVASAERDLVFVIGAGFDPRALVGISSFLERHEGQHVDVLVLELPKGGDDPLTAELQGENGTLLGALVDQHDVQLTRLDYPEGGDRHAAGQQLSWAVQEHAVVARGASVVVDISGLPSSIYFPVIGGILAKCNDDKFTGDLQVLVCENPKIDAIILDEGAAEAGPLNGFKHGLTSDSAATETVVWAPVIGESQGEQMRLLFDYLSPHEISPILPFPARNPRRADELLLEHRSLLFEVMEIDPHNIIYASETNPFDLYRTLYRLSGKYTGALAPLGTSKVVTSAHASKLLSIGVLLAAWERELPFVTAGPTGYTIAAGVDIRSFSDENRLSCLWLAGQPYK